MWRFARFVVLTAEVPEGSSVLSKLILKCVKNMSVVQTCHSDG